MSRRNIAAISLFLIGSVALLACSEDDDADPKAAASGTGAASTGATGPGGGGAGATGGGGSGATGGGGASGCSALPLTDALVEAGTWDDSFTIAGFAGQDGFGPTVHDLALDADGSLLAVGYFSYIGKDKVRPFARLDSGTWAADPRLDMDLPQPEISAVAVADDGRVAISTHSLFPSELEQREGGIYVSNDTGGFTLVGEFAGAVRTMTWFENKLWVGGYFELDGGSAPPNLALWDGVTWEAPPGGPVQEPSTVFEIAHDGPGLMIGGYFANIGGIAAQSAARFAGGNWEAYDLPDSTVMAFARDGNDTLYAGGLMSVEGSVVNGGIARWNGTTWGSMDGGLANLSFRGVVSDLAVLDGELLVAGCFNWAGGAAEAPGTIEVPGMARWTGTAWEALDDGTGTAPISAWISSLKCGDEGPAAVWESERQRMLVDGSRLYLAGSFAGEGGVPSQSIIAYENGQWIAQGEAGRGWSGTARALAVGGPSCSLYALGATHAGDLEIGQGVVKDEGDAWVQVAGPVPAGKACYSIAADAAGAAYIACEYLKSEADPFYTGVVYKSVGDDWEQLGEEYEGGIAALAVDPAGHLWVVGGGEKGFVTREEGGTFTTTAFDARVSAIAFAPTADGEPVRAAVAGFFTKVEGTQAVGVAQFDGTAWNALGGGVLAYITSVAYGPDDVIYVGTGDGSPGVPVLSRWDGNVWEDVAQPEPGPVDAGYQILSLVARGKYVVAAGFGWPESGERNLFLWNDETKVWSPLAGGVPAVSVDTAVLAGNGLWFGGFIAEAGLADARIPSVGIAHLK
jgi:hypothetical protein